MRQPSRRELIETWYEYMVLEAAKWLGVNIIRHPFPKRDELK